MLMVLMRALAFFINHNIQFKIVHSTYIAITTGSSAFMIACVYRPPGSCSDAFCDKLLCTRLH